MSDHRAVSETRLGDPIYGAPVWQVNELGELTGEALPSRATTASRTCACGLMIVAPTSEIALRSFARHLADPAYPSYSPQKLEEK